MAQSSSQNLTAHPAQLGDFAITGVLGEGGSGVVYEARWGHREVALKVLRPALVSAGRERERFFVEARLLGDITHPSVVKVLGAGELPDGRPYLAMEKLPGETLATRLKRGPLALADALVLFGQLTTAVEALHRQGLVHRDLKPENVMLVPGPGGASFAVLLDFGIAKGVAAPASTVTQDGGVRGTPAYMAPERFFGQPASVATDVYELGVSLYAMLTARLPWSDYLDPEARLQPVPLSALVVVPPALEAAVSRALSTRPALRPASAAELAASVSGAVGGAMPAGPARRTVDLRGAATDAPASPLGAAPAHGAQMIAAFAPLPAAAQAILLPHASTIAAASPGVGASIPPPPPETPMSTVTRQAPGGTTTTTTARRRWPLVAGGVAIAGLAGGGAFLAARATGDPPVAQMAAGATSETGAGSSPGAEALKSLANLVIDTAAKKADEPDAPPVTHYRDELAAGVAHLPDDARVVLGVAVADALDDSAMGSILRAIVQTPRMSDMHGLEGCKVDVLESARWIVAGALPDDEEIDIVLSGDWTREAIEACAVALARVEAKHPEKVTVRQDGAITAIGGGYDPMYFGWIDDHTFAMSTRQGMDLAAMRARIAGTGDGAPPPRLARMLEGIDRKRAIWFGGDVDGALGEPVANGAPFSRSTRGTIEIGDGIQLAATLEYPTVADARAAEQVIDKAMHPDLSDKDSPEAKEDPEVEAAAGLVGGAMIGLLGDFEVSRRDLLVDVTADLNRFGALALGKMVEVGVSRMAAEETAPLD